MITEETIIKIWEEQTKSAKECGISPPSLEQVRKMAELINQEKDVQTRL